MGLALHTVSALVAVTIVCVGGCIANPYRSADEKPAIKPDADAGPGPSTEVSTSPSDPSATSATSATTTEAASLPDAQAPQGPCESQPAVWSVGASSCTAVSGPLADGATQTLTDSTPSDTGSVTVACAAGKLTYSGAVCEPPKEFDVNNPTGCINGYCIAVVGGQCGVADPAKATAFCVARGYAAYTTFKTGPGINGGRQCAADGNGCFINANPSCNIIFTTVFCRH